jgi:hypothetical protein
MQGNSRIIFLVDTKAAALENYNFACGEIAAAIRAAKERG